MSTRYRADLLRAAREGRNWSKTRLIYALRQAAAEEGRTLPSDATLARSIARWENGHTYPSDYVPLLARVYGEPAHRLGLVAVVEEQLPKVEYAASLDDGMEAAAALWRADLDASPALIAAGPDVEAWHSAPLAWLVAPEREPLPKSRERGQVGMDDVEMVRSTVSMFVEMDNRFGGAHGRQALVQYLAGDVAEMLKARRTDAVGRALFATVAEGTLLAAWMSYDSGHHGLAQRYFIQALRFAQAGDDRRLAGSILSAMSHQATYLGRYTEGANLARAARMGTDRCGTPTMTAQFRAMEARALARLGDNTGCAAAMSEASSLFERHNPGENPEWIGYFDEAELAAELGHCFRDLGQARDAVTHAEHCLGGTDGTYVRSDFFVTVVLAEAQLQQGETEQACRTALVALDSGRRLKSARCVSYLREFRTKLERHSPGPVVAEFLEEAAGHRLWQQTG